MLDAYSARGADIHESGTYQQFSAEKLLVLRGWPRFSWIDYHSMSI